jgi:hypothetical protein
MLLKAQYSHNFTPNFEAWFYELDSEVFSIGGVILNNRYPEIGSCVNTDSDSLLLILEGKCTVFTQVSFNKLIAGDVYLIPKNVWYYIDDLIDRKLKIWMVNNPPLGLNNHIIDEEANLG